MSKITDLIRGNAQYRIASDWFNRVKDRPVNDPERRSAQKAKLRTAKKFEKDQRANGLIL